MNKCLSLFAIILCIGLFACSKKADLSACGKQGGANAQLWQGHNPMPGPMFAPPDQEDMARLCKEIGISEQKVGKISSIIRQSLKGMNENIINIQQEELNVRKELLKDKPDIASVRRSIESKTKIFADIEVSQIQRDLDIKALLTTDEYERWVYRNSQRQRMRNHFPLPPNIGGLPQSGGLVPFDAQRGMMPQRFSGENVPPPAAQPPIENR
jgi:hypothetical protein